MIPFKGKSLIFHASSASHKSRATSRAIEEQRLVDSAAQGVETVKYGPGVKPKISRSIDHQDKFDQMNSFLKSYTSLMNTALKEIIDLTGSSRKSTSTESPPTKRHKGYKEMSHLISILIKEKLDRISADMDTASMDKEIKKLEKEREAVSNCTPTNLGKTFDGEAD